MHVLTDRVLVLLKNKTKLNKLNKTDLDIHGWKTDESAS